MRRGFRAGLAALFVLFIAMAPGRLGPAAGWRMSFLGRVMRVLGGMLLDLGAVAIVSTLAVAGVALLFTVVRPATARRQRWLPVMIAAPLGLAWCALSVTAQEVKHERGAFPTVFDLAEGGSNLSFLEGALGFLTYSRIYGPLLASLVVLVLGLRWYARRDAEAAVDRRREWAFGLVAAMAVGACSPVVSAVLGRVANRFSPAYLGDPFTGLIESGVDVLRHQEAATPRQLVLEAKLPPSELTAGAARLGWPERGPSCSPHPYARPLDRKNEPKAPVAPLLDALERMSETLFVGPEVEPVNVFVLLLESFRADDLHALNPRAPRVLNPFVTGLYEQSTSPDGGVLASRRVYQAGVRSAQGLAALLCGVGTLPYNLSVIRDLQPFPTRCLSDVLTEAGFHGEFYFGSDPAFDEMQPFLEAHGVRTIVGQKQLPADAPKGAWGGLSDFVVFDEALRRAAEGSDAGESADGGTVAPRLSLIMSLTNHSPYARPEDLPPEVEQRVDEALKQALEGTGEDRKRLVTNAYTDTAVERFFEGLERTGLAERSLVVVTADHSTGETYLWGPESDAAKARIPFLIVVPEALRARLPKRAAFEKALGAAQGLIDVAPLSQNDLPALVLALLSRHPAVKRLEPGARWHTLGGQRTSPYFKTGGSASEVVLGINGISELFALDRQEGRVGDYEDSVFLRTRADRYRVTPRLIPVTAALADVLRCAEQH